MKTQVSLFLFMFGITLTIHSQIPDEGLVGYWPFNGNANDTSGNNNNGIVNGATLTIDRYGHENSSYYFDGSNDLIEGQNSGNNLPIVSQSRTINSWIRFEGGTPNFGPDINIFQYGTNSSGAVTFHLFIHIQDTMAYAGIGNGFGEGTIIDTTDLFDTQWHLITGIYSGLPDDSLFIYIDSKLCSKGKISTTPSTSLSNNWIIGKFMANAGYFKGCIDDIRIYNRVLNADEINALYNESQVSNISVEESGKISLMIYPNPTKDILYINNGKNYNQLADYKIKIINITGSVIFESHVNKELFEIELNKFGQTGLFFIQIMDNSDNTIDIRKIILQ